MFSGVAYRRVDDQARRFGLIRLRQSTALIGATLLFCLTADFADAKTIYYNGDSTSTSPDPTPGGQWSRLDADLSWLRPQGGNYVADDFDNDDDVIFNSDDTVLIDVEIVENVRAGSILVEDGSFLFTAADGIVLRSGNIDIDAGAALEVDVELDLGLLGGGTSLLNNFGTLTLSHDTILGTIDNSGDIILNSDVTLDSGNNTNTLWNNSAGGSITAQGGQRTLYITSQMQNGGLLDGGTGGSRLIIASAPGRDAVINLGPATQFANDVVLRTRINNSSDLDLIHVPGLYGDFINNSSGIATADNAVAGRGFDFDNNGSLVVNSAMTGLGVVDNSGTLTVGSAGTLAATTISHTDGTLISSGTLRGAITAADTATLSGAIEGSYRITAGTTTIVGDLDFSASQNGGLLDVDGGTLAINDGLTVTVGNLVNDGTVNFSADLPAVPVGVVVDGDMRSSGTITGTATITGDLTLTGDSGDFAGAALTVDGALINDQTNLVGLASFSGISYGQLINSGRLNINLATTGPITNLADGDLRISSAVAGNVTSSGVLTLANNISGQLRVAAGTATVTGSVLPTGPTVTTVIVDAGGNLVVSGSNLSASTIDAAGRVEVQSGRTLTAARLDILGNGANGSLVEGTVSGAVEVESTGALELDGARITGALLNRGRLTTDDAMVANIALQGGLDNYGTAQVGLSNRRAQITGELRNRTGGDATVFGNVTAGNGLTGAVVNGGNLALVGNVAGQVTNGGTLTMTGNMARLSNSGQATVNGTVSTEAVNSGNMTLTGAVNGSISNQGPGAVLNIAGVLTTPTLTNTEGRVNVQNAATLNLGGGALTNTAGAILDVAGRVQATTGAVNLQNQQNATLTVQGTGTVAGNLSNSGAATVAGRVTGTANNAGSGTMTLAGGAQIDGALTNAGAVTVSAGADATVGGDTSNNGGRLTVAGRLNSDVLNNSTGVVRITGGTIAGNLTNAAGATVYSTGTVDGNVTNNGRYVLSGISDVTGDFTNSGELTQNTNNSELLVEGTFTNTGDINAADFLNKTLTIRAGTFRNPGSIELGEGVRIDALIENANLLRITSDTTLFDDLNNGADGLVYVLADVDTEGVVNIGNDGEFTVSNNGTLRGVQTIENRGTFSILGGSRVQADDFTNADGDLRVSGELASDVVNRSGANLALSGTIDGDLRNEGQSSLAGRITGAFTGASGSQTSVVGALTVGQATNGGNLQVQNSATLTSGQTILNTAIGTMGVAGTVNGNLQNNGTLALTDGVINGNLGNAGIARLNGRISGQLLNDGGDADLQISARLVVDSAVNRAGRILVGADRTLELGDTLLNTGTGRLVIQGDVIARSGGVLNQSSRGMAMTAGSTLTGNLANETIADLAGTVDGNVLNQGSMGAAGAITGTLTNDGGVLATIGDLRVEGVIVNQRRPLAGETPAPGQPQRGPGDASRLTVASGTTLTAVSGLRNDASSRVVVDGTLAGNVVNAGIFDLNDSLTGSLTSTGTAQLQGAISGNFTYSGGAAALTGDLSVGGVFDSAENFTVADGRTLEVGTFLNRASAADDAHALTVGGTIDGDVINRGRLVALDGAALGATENTGTIDMTTNAASDDVLTVNGGLSGDGTFALDLDLEGNDGAGSSDRVVITGGAATGDYRLAFDSVQDVGPTDRSRRILVFDVDESQGSRNSFEFTSEGLPIASERIIYSIVQEGDYGDLYMTDNINPAFGAITGNVALTQSLIGSVVNRPSSPFVPGLAVDPGEQPCGPGAWARALAGRASAEGSTTNGLNSVASTIEASYRGIQFGGDLACFDGGFKGWNVAAGVIGGINDGTTTQPVFGPSNTGVEGAEDTIYSINDGEFRQIYGGIYLTASRDRLSADLQIRRERTSFKINNTPTGDDSEGLQISDSEFDSNATTISGSVSYSYQLPREGWMFVPTAGFAFSNISTDTIYFEDATLELEDSKNRVGFLGGTLSRTFINPTKNSAFLAFGTATVYKDFADDTTSTFTLFEDGEEIRTEQLESSNLGVYGELSLGVNYLKVLNQGSARAPRQFNASIRLDGRTGDVLDSYGLTAQVRLQF